MVFFITVLRALASCLITNAHYTGIYPTDLIANGGLIGDIIFFAVSGYCLINVKGSFVQWYGKRLYRVYLPVFVITAVFGILGMYSIRSDNWFQWFVFPTYYHFVASIVLLYIPFYFCMKSEFVKNHLISLMLLIAGIWLAVYIVVYDRSYYHIDNVHEPMIRFLFLEAMLFGAWFRINADELRGRYRSRDGVYVVLLIIVYFGSKLLFSRMPEISGFQFLNQIIIFGLLVVLFQLFARLDNTLEALDKRVKRVITVIADMTLEIYLVQYVLIAVMRNWFFFPLNWLALTTAIVVSAWILHFVCKWLYGIIGKMTEKMV